MAAGSSNVSTSSTKSPVRWKTGKGTLGFAQFSDRQAEENMQDEVGEVG